MHYRVTEKIEAMELDIPHADQIEADVECLMCARVIGHLHGHRWRTTAGQRTERTIANLTTYRDNEPAAQPRPVRPREQFRCRHCGGQGFVGDISARTPIEKVPSHVCPIHAEPKTGPGRPPIGCRCEPRRLAA